MAKLIIVCGLPGSGKTTLAKELSKKLKVVCIHKDSIKEKLYESMKLSTLEDSKMIGMPSIEVMLKLAEDQLINDIDIIVEAPFQFSKDYPIFDKLKEKYDLDLVAIICSINRGEREQRFLNRERHGAHHDWKRTFEAFPKNEKEYDYANIPGKQIRITTDRPVNILAEEIIKQLK